MCIRDRGSSETLRSKTTINTNRTFTRGLGWGEENVKISGQLHSSGG